MHVQYTSSVHAYGGHQMIWPTNTAKIMALLASYWLTCYCMHAHKGLAWGRGYLVLYMYNQAAVG